MTCPYCTGGLWLNDTPGLGPCVCVTADRMEAAETERDALQEQLDHANKRLGEAWDLTSTGAEGCETRSLVDQLTDDITAIAARCGSDGTAWNNLVDVENLVGNAIEEADEAREAATDALRDYLISQGLPATPVRLEDPHLDRLACALLT